MQCTFSHYHLGGTSTFKSANPSASWVQQTGVGYSPSYIHSRRKRVPFQITKWGKFQKCKKMCSIYWDTYKVFQASYSTCSFTDIEMIHFKMKTAQVHISTKVVLYHFWYDTYFYKPKYISFFLASYFNTSWFIMKGCFGFRFSPYRIIIHHVAHSRLNIHIHISFGLKVCWCTQKQRLFSALCQSAVINFLFFNSSAIRQCHWRREF